MSYIPNPATSGVGGMFEYNNVDKGAAGQLMNSTGPQACSGSAFITVAAGDVFTMLCNNTTDTTDITIVDMNYRLKRYAMS
jgi:hypothetical protein